MARQPQPHSESTSDTSLGPTELDVLMHIQKSGPSKVKDVAAHFAERSGLARTTVLTVMERLRGKGRLTRSREQEVWVYQAAESRGGLVQDLISKFVGGLGGKVSPFVAYLAQAEDLTEDEQRMLEKLAKKLDRPSGAGGDR